MLQIQLLFIATALFVQIELLSSSVRRFPPNGANGVAVFEGSPIRYNTADIAEYDELPPMVKKRKLR